MHCNCNCRKYIIVDLQLLWYKEVTRTRYAKGVFEDPRPRGSPSSKFHLRKPEVPHKYDTVLGVSTRYKMLPGTRITKDVVRQQTNVFHGYYKSWLWENFQEAKVLRYYNLSIHSSTITSLSKHLNTKYDWHLHYWKSLRSLANRIQVHHKGQLSSKCLFGVFNSSKKRTKTIRPEVS